MHDRTRFDAAGDRALEHIDCVFFLSLRVLATRSTCIFFDCERFGEQNRCTRRRKLWNAASGLRSCAGVINFWGPREDGPVGAILPVFWVPPPREDRIIIDSETESCLGAVHYYPIYLCSVSHLQQYLLLAEGARGRLLSHIETYWIILVVRGPTTIIYLRVTINCAY